MVSTRWILIGVGVAGLATLGVVARARFGHDGRTAGGDAPATSGSAAAGDRPVSIVAVPVVRRDMPIYLSGLGSVTAFNTVTVKSQVDGRLDRIAFREGQEVHKGEVLAQIDPRPFAIQLHIAQAALARDRAVANAHKVTLDRVLSLAKEGLATQQQVDDARAALAQAEAVTVGDGAQIESARLSLDYARIVAPIDGTTGVRLVDAGNLVHPSDPGGIVVITQLDPISVLFTLPQDDLPRVAAEMNKGPLTVEAQSRDGDAMLGKGAVTLVDNQINQATATIRLKATFANGDHALWPNQFVKVRLLLSTRRDALVVPAAVVQRGPQGTFAYVVGPDQRAMVRPVTVDTLEGDFAVIGKGLEVGEQVVSEGQYQLRPGARVVLKSMESAPPRGPGSGAAPASSDAPGRPASSHARVDEVPPRGPGGQPGAAP
ncbi:MAG: efflux RND transporter periplasmic adaptor subunit [Minicystis sp.]